MNNLNNNKELKNRITICDGGYVHIQIGNITVHFTHKDFLAFMESGAKAYQSLIAKQETYQ